MTQVVWQQSLSRLKERLSVTEIGCWVQAIHPVAIHERRLYGEVPSVLHLEQVRARLAGEIDGVLEELLGPGAELVLSVNKDLRRHETEREPENSQLCAYRSTASSSARAMRRPCDRLGGRRASSAAYNPLFLFRRGARRRSQRPPSRSCSAAAAAPRLVRIGRDARPLIRAIFNGGIDALRSRLRHLDALIVDDIQFLAGKERMQEVLPHLQLAQGGGQATCSPAIKRQARSPTWRSDGGAGSSLG